MRILAIDYGDARIGLALSDESETLASPVGTYKSQSMRKDMDGSSGERVSKTKSFGNMLERVSGIQVEYKDERLTTVTAEQTLIECGMRREKRKQVIDTLSAQIILQSYLDARKRINKK